jgi:hypothetical protein
MMTKPLALALCLVAGPAWAQVEVQIRTAWRTLQRRR